MNKANIFTEQLKNGDEKVLFQLMLHYYNDLFRYGVKFTADAAFTKETVNEFFLHAWDKRKKLMAADNIESYLLVSYKHFLIQELRKKNAAFAAKQTHTEPAELPYEEYIIATQNETAVKNTLHKAVASLPPRQKQLVQLRFYEQMSYEEIASATSLSVRTVYNKLHEALKKLRASEVVKNVYRNLYSLLF